MTNLYANCSVCNLTNVTEASSTIFPTTGVTSGSTIGDDSANKGVNDGGVTFGFGVAFGVLFEAGVVPVAGVLSVTGVVFATGVVLDFDEPFFGATGEKSRSSSSSDPARERAET